VHHRIVNYNDPVPSVPAPWMNTTAKIWIPGAVMLFSNPAPGGLLFALGLVRLSGNPYQHHGAQQHFMPIILPDGTQSSVLWAPGCESIEEAACHRALRLHGDMPDRPNLIKQLVRSSHHFMVTGYIPAAWATLRRWQQTLDTNGTLVTPREFELIEKALSTMQQQLRDKNYELHRRRPANQRSDEDSQTALSAEVDRLDTSRKRLASLRWRRLQTWDVYGSHARSPNLQPCLNRWFTHQENRERSQVASIPSQPDDGWGPGRVQTLDIDSIV
ncbi:lipase family protein, partial [Pseudomonas fluorescens]